MARTLKLYKNKTPNLHSGDHYHFTSFSDYLTELGTPFLTLTLDNYRIVDGVVDIKTSATPSNDIMDVSYMVEQDGNYHRCYWVESSDLFVDSVRFIVKVDLWGSYFDKATFSNMVALRTTRNIGNGIFNDIKQSYGPPTYAPLTNTSLLLYCVFAVEYKTSNQLFTTKSSAIQLYAASLYGLSRDTIIDTFLKNLSAVNKMGNIDCGVVGAWITESDTLVMSNQAVEFYYGGGASDKIDGYLVYPECVNKSFSGPTDPYKVHVAGTKFNGLRLKNFDDYTNEITYQFITSNSELQVFVRQGENSKEITSSFAVNITSNGAENVNGKNTINAIKSIGGLGIAIGSLVSGNIPTALIGTAGALSGIIDPQERSNVGGGDAFTTFWAGGYRITPYQLASYVGVGYDDYTKVGAYFNLPKTFTELFNASLLTGCTKTFLQARVDVDGIPTKAIEYIESQLANGVYIKKLGT